jgi:MFS family permease
MQKTSAASPVPKSSAAWGAVFFAMLAATYVINAADRMIFPVVLRPLREEYALSLTEGGFLATIYLFGLGVGGIGTGYLLDRWSRKTTIVIGILVYSFFTILTVLAYSFLDMALYRTLTGVGEAMQTVALVIAVGAFYPASRTFALGLIQCAFGIGQFLGPRLGTQLMALATDWRMPFYAFGAAGFAGAMAAMLVSRGFTEHGETERATASAEDSHLPQGLWTMNAICTMAVVMLRSFPFYGFFGLYTNFLTEQLGFPLGAAAGALSLFGLGPFFSPLAGLIADRVNQKLFQILALAAMAVSGLLVFNLATAPFSQNALALLFGIGGGFAFVNGYSLAQRSVQAQGIARISGYFFALATLPASISGFVMARLVEEFGWQTGANAMILGFLVPAILISLFIDTRQVSGRGRRLTEGRRIFT